MSIPIGGEAAYSNAMCFRRFTPILLFAGLLVISIVSSAAAEHQRSRAAAAEPPRFFSCGDDELVTSNSARTVRAGRASAVYDGPRWRWLDDLVIAARCKNPMADRDEYSFQIIDPYDSFLGFSGRQSNIELCLRCPERRGLCLLIIHGDGPDAWRSEKPRLSSC